MKVFSQTPVNPDNPPKWIRMRPDLSDDEARLIKRLPEIAYSAIWGQAQGRLEYKACELSRCSFTAPTRASRRSTAAT